jgi:uncharacterized protein YggU (UPF0235/DUF167 family)
MADALTEAQNLIRSSIAAIDAEAQSLTAALESLNGGTSLKRKGRPSGKRSAARKGPKGKKRAAKGARRLEVIAAIDKKPGITGARLAKELGIPASQVYNICGTLVKEKTIRKRGATYEIVPGTNADKARTAAAAA